MKRYKVEISEQFNIIVDDDGKAKMFDSVGSEIDSAHNIDILLKYWAATVVAEYDV